MLKTALSTAAFILLAAAAAADDDDDDGPSALSEINVHCDRGETITDALAAGAAGSPLTIIIRGICNENVTISRDDVTLKGIDPASSAILGVSETAVDQSPITILAAQRIVVQNLRIANSGSSGFVAITSFFTIENCVIENNGLHGIVLTSGGLGRINDNVIRENGRNGILAFGGVVAQVSNSSIRNNERNGILVDGGGSAIIGQRSDGSVGPNDITSNGRRGIQVSNAGYAGIFSNTITSNERDGVGVFSGASVIVQNNVIAFNERNGVGLFGNAWADIIDNEIESNARNGVSVGGASSASLEGNLIVSNNGPADSFAGGIGVFTGDVQLAGGNEIRENTGGGILVIQGSLTMDDQGAADVIELNSDYGLRGEGFASLVLLQGSIRNNVTDGIQVVGQSYLVIRNTTVQDNGESGIRIRRDSGVRFLDPATIVTGHTFFDLECLDLESSVEGVLDGVVVIDPACTGF